VAQRRRLEHDEQQHGRAAHLVVGEELVDDGPEPGALGRAVTEPGGARGDAADRTVSQVLQRGDQQVVLGAEVVLDPD